VAATVPLVAMFLQAGGPRHVGADVPSAGDDAAVLATLLAVALAGIGSAAARACRPRGSPVRSCSGPCWAGSVRRPTCRRLVR
jgi:hypothetical protein